MLKHRFRIYFLQAFLGSFFIFCVSYNPAVAQQADTELSILIFTKTEGFRHSSIPTGVKAVENLAARENIRTTHTEDARYFHPDSLSSFGAVVFLSTTGDVLNDTQETAFEQYIQNGGGYLGIHAASDTEYEWPWYGRLVGAYFASHPEVQEATIEVHDHSHPATSFLPEEWSRTDEWYNFKNINDETEVLMELDESSYEGGENGDFHPIAWYHNYDGGRAFYTGLGHTDESYSEPLFIDHLRGALQYVLGQKE